MKTLKEVNERIKKVESEIFLLNMADRWTLSDYDSYDYLHNELCELYAMKKTLEA